MAGPLKHLSRIAIAAAFVAATPVSSLAHPHVFADARLEIVTTPDGQIAELRNVWRFDELFSSTVLLDYDENQNLKLDDPEKAEVGRIVKESLLEFNYYATLTRNGRDLTVDPPDQIFVDYSDGQILMIFAVKPSKPLPLEGNLSIGIYDPTMYTSIDFINDSDIEMTGAGAKGCERKVVRPDPDEVIANNQANLTEAFFETTGAGDLSKLFATRLDLTC